MNFSVKNFFSKCDDGNYFQGKFYFEGAISGDNFPQRQLSSGAIIRGGAIMQGAIIPGAIFLGVNCPRTILYALSFKTGIFMPFASSFNAANQLM